MFRITQGRGFHMQFENGWTVSVQFGTYNYCDNQFTHESLGELFKAEPDATADSISSRNAEIAAWDANGIWYDFGDNTVMGYVAPDELLGYMNMIAALPPAP